MGGAERVHLWNLTLVPHRLIPTHELNWLIFKLCELNFERVQLECELSQHLTFTMFLRCVMYFSSGNAHVAGSSVPGTSQESA